MYTLEDAYVVLPFALRRQAFARITPKPYPNY